MNGAALKFVPPLRRKLKSVLMAASGGVLSCRPMSVIDPSRSPRVRKSKARSVSSRRRTGSRPRSAWRLWRRRQRLRCRRRDRVHAAGRRAASERAGRRRAGHRPRRRRGKPEVICGQGPAPAGATIAHYRSEGWTSCPAPACSPPACPARSRPGCCCCATTAPCRLPRCWRRRSDMRRTAIRWSSAPMPPSRRSRELFREHWPTSAAVYLPTARYRRRERCSPTRRSPRPIAASSRKPKAPAAIGARKSSRRAKPGRRASSPRRSIASAARKR